MSEDFKHFLWQYKNFHSTQKMPKLQFRVQWLESCDRVYFTKARRRALPLFTKNTQRKKLPKVWDMSKIRYIISRPDTYNMQTRIILFPDQEKLLQQVDGD